MSDLTAFLRARVDEDEATVKVCADYDALTCGDLSGVHLTTARALREVKAKRVMLARHAPNPEHPAFCDYCNDGLLEQHWPCPDVLDIVAIYRDHPDYRQEWKP